MLQQQHGVDSRGKKHVTLLLLFFFHTVCKIGFIFIGGEGAAGPPLLLQKLPGKIY
jgi:hypothetical protein